MKKQLLLLALFAGLGFTVKAQSKPISIGLKAGVAFPNISVSDNDFEGELKANTSFYFGGLVDVSLGNTFSFQPGLTLIGKGAKNEYSETDEDGTYSVSAKKNLMYLEIPVNLIANFETGAGKVFIGAGPYYGLALSGKNKYEARLNGMTIEGEADENDDIQFGKDGELKRGDYGINFLGGYQLSNGFNIHAGYGLGLGNIAQDSGDSKTKNKLFSIGVGFTF
jgi:hypothetical protein